MKMLTTIRGNSYQGYSDNRRLQKMDTDNHSSEENGNMDAIVNRYYHDNVQLNQKDAEKRRDIAFPNVEKILTCVNKTDPRFGREPVRAGSYWQGLKVDKADEFDYSITLEGIGQLHFATAGSRYYGFNKHRDPDQKTIPQDLDVVPTSVPLPSPPKGYLYVTVTPEHLYRTAGWREIDDVTRRSDPGKIDIVPFLVRKRLKELLTSAKREQDLRGEVWLSPRVSGPALTMFFKVRSREIGIDFAPIIRAHFPFPSWIDWPRAGAKWPDAEKIREIKNFGINVVAKKDFWWMLSFAELEKKLVEKVDADGGKRKEGHRMMKKLNADVWCNTSKPVISSYILKNIWFWEMENYPGSSSWDNDHVWIRLKSMTEELLKYIRSRYLRQYFYPDINLLEKKDVNDLDVAAKKIVTFLDNPCKYLTAD